MRTYTVSDDALLGGPRPRIKRVKVNGVPVRLYSLGFLCAVTQLAPVTFRLWQRQSFMPAPVLKLPTAVRWYTAAEITQYNQVLRQHYNGSRDKRALCLALHARHAALQQFFHYRLSPELVAAGQVPADYLALNPKLEQAISQGRTNESNEGGTQQQNPGGAPAGQPSDAHALKIGEVKQGVEQRRPALRHEHGVRKHARGHRQNVRGDGGND